jgi:hypothetical protein
MAFRDSPLFVVAWAVVAIGPARKGMAGPHFEIHPVSMGMV